MEVEPRTFPLDVVWQVGYSPEGCRLQQSTIRQSINNKWNLSNGSLALNERINFIKFLKYNRILKIILLLLKNKVIQRIDKLNQN